MKLKVKKLYFDSQMPFKRHLSDAGLDLFVHRTEDKGNYVKVYTGLAIQPEVGYFMFLLPRSSVKDYGLILHNSTGVIDRDYTGEIIANFYKTASYKMPEVGDRLVQLVIQEQYTTEIEEVAQLETTERGAGGFGSTGK